MLPMYMGVILMEKYHITDDGCAPHVYGGDPEDNGVRYYSSKCSPCIWG